MTNPTSQSLYEKAEAQFEAFAGTVHALITQAEKAQPGSGQSLGGQFWHCQRQVEDYLLLLGGTAEAFEFEEDE